MTKQLSLTSDIEFLSVQHSAHEGRYSQTFCCRHGNQWVDEKYPILQVRITRYNGSDSHGQNYDPILVYGSTRLQTSFR